MQVLPFTYAFLNSAKQFSEQNSRLPLVVGKTYFKGSLTSLHQVQETSFFGGRPGPRILELIGLPDIIGCDHATLYDIQPGARVIEPKKKV